MEDATSRTIPTPIAIAVLAVLLIAALGAFYYYRYMQKPDPEAPLSSSEIETGPDVSSDVSAAVETPAEKLPETNPFSGYKNPFE